MTNSSSDKKIFIDQTADYENNTNSSLETFSKIKRKTHKKVEGGTG